MSRAWPTLSAYTVAQNPGGSVMPPLPEGHVPSGGTFADAAASGARSEGLQAATSAAHPTSTVHDLRPRQFRSLLGIEPPYSVVSGPAPRATAVRILPRGPAVPTGMTVSAGTFGCPGALLVPRR